jgi:hypothetical protein
MIRDIAYRIGRIEGNLGEIGQKFLITLDETNGQRTFVYHAHVFGYDYKLKETPRHTEIARKFGLINVLGGGILDFCPEDMTLRTDDKRIIAICGISRTFGGVPHKVMERFIPLLLSAYQQIDPRVKEINNYCHDVGLKEVWQQFGFEANYDPKSIRMHSHS